MITIVETSGENHWNVIDQFPTVDKHPNEFKAAHDCLNSGQLSFERKAIVGDDWLTGEPADCEMFCDYKTFHKAIVLAAYKLGTDRSREEVDYGSNVRNGKNY